MLIYLCECVDNSTNIRMIKRMCNYAVNRRADFEDDISLEEFRTGEKCLLYVALTRARKSACVTCYGGLSELIV